MQNNISIARLEKALGYGNGSLAKAKTIKAERLAEIADYFNVSVSELFPETYSDSKSHQAENSRPLSKTPEASRIAAFVASDEELEDFLKLAMSLSCDDFKTVHKLLRSLARK